MESTRVVTLEGVKKLGLLVIALILFNLMGLAILPNSILNSHSIVFDSSFSEMSIGPSLISKKAYVPRILFVLSTYEGVYETRIKKIYETWGRRVVENPEYMRFLFIGFVNQTKIPNMLQSSCVMGYWEGMLRFLCLIIFSEYG